MYLSRIALNTQRGDTRNILASPHRLHALVEGSFPPKLESKDRNLWRLDHLNHYTYLLVLSKEKPDFTHVVEQVGWPATEQKWITRDYTRLLTQVKQGQNWQFRLRANPVRSVKQNSPQESGEAQKRGKVYAHVTVEQQELWLFERAERNGFKLERDSFKVVHREVCRFWRQKKPVTLGIATFEGQLEVTDVDLFRAVLINGIGRGKAYGCGLLTIIKVPS